METIERICLALKQFDTKKDNLKKAFEDLQNHSSSLSSFTLTWSDIDTHFSNLHTTLVQKFEILKNQKIEESGKLDVILPRPELIAFCENMNGFGLRKYIIENKAKERVVIGTELREAFKCAPNAAAMVLDALEGFYVPNSKGDKDQPLLILRKSCLVMLEALLDSKVEVSSEVRERAKSLALDWKKKVSIDGSSTFEPYGFLYLVVDYGLVDFFGMDDLLDMAVIATKFGKGIQLLHRLCPGDKMPDLMQKIISKGLQLQAVKCILEFGLVDKYPPVPLLEEYTNDAKKKAEKILKDGKQSLQSMNEATTKEVNALTSVLNTITHNNLEAESLKQSAMKRIEKLEKEKANRKKQPQPPGGPKLNPQNLSGVKRPRSTTQINILTKPAICQPAVPVPHVASIRQVGVPFQQSSSSAPNFATTEPYIQTVQEYQRSYPQFVPGGEVKVPNVANFTSSTVPPYQQSYVQHAPGGQATRPHEAASPYQRSYLQPTGLLPDHHTRYSGLPAGVYGSAEASLGMAGSSTHAQSHVYATEPNKAPGYYDGSANYAGYAMPPPQHRPSYYSQ